MATKQEYIGFRTTTEIKNLLQKLSDEGYRTVSRQCEMAIIEWLKERGHLDKKQ